ncbi:MAG: glycosyl hydrolase [Actinomycetota bacterium]
MRKPLILAMVVALLAGLAAPSAKPSRGLIVGIFDEQATLGDPDWAYPQYKSLGVEALRVNLYWGGPSGVARKGRPANAVNPADPAYDWSVYDAMVKRSKDSGIKPVFSILWTPGWAASAKNRAPRKMVDLRNFAYAAAKRYSGSFRPTPDALPLPAVRFWLAWNEPNNPVFLKPQFVPAGRGHYKLSSPRIYAQMCNSIWSGVHLTGLAGEKVACGVTAPRGNNTGTQPRASVSPLIFLRGMKRAGARFDAYAHHPYYQHPNEPPNKPPPGTRAITLGNIKDLIRELTRLYGQKRVWITEYGYQTNPPDRSFGVSFAKQARYVTQAFGIARANPRIDMMIWFLMKDEARIGNGWQSGFFTASGRRKPSWLAFKRIPK